MLSVIISVFCGAYYSIKEAGDGVKAFELFSPGAFDVVFMDLVMPNMDGWEASRIIRSLDKEVQIIICSAIFAKICQEANAVLVKPFTIDEVAQDLRRWLRMQITTLHIGNYINTASILAKGLIN